jgi:kynurenine formamidase
MPHRPRRISGEEFDGIFKSVCNWGRWGPDDERGTLNLITPERVRRAAALVSSGRTVSLAVPINKAAGPDNPRPPVHRMVRTFDPASAEAVQFATDSLSTEFHGDCHTHLDALCHVAYKGRTYNGRPLGIVTEEGACVADIAAFAAGIVGRGVLLDIPRLRGMKWLAPGEAVSAEELRAAEKAEGVRLGEGDVLLFRTGHHRRRLDEGPWDVGYEGEGRAGLDVDAIPFLHERGVAAFLPDGDGETVPAAVEGIPYPIHALQVAAMGMACADSLQFEELVEVCEAEGRWEFMLAAAPLRLPGGTGSLFSPIAVF